MKLKPENLSQRFEKKNSFIIKVINWHRNKDWASVITYVKPLYIISLSYLNVRNSSLHLSYFNFSFKYHVKGLFYQKSINTYKAELSILTCLHLFQTLTNQFP